MEPVFTPEVCARTGRIMTEWFEHPELTEDDIRDLAYEEAGVDKETFVFPPAHDWSNPDRLIGNKIINFINKRRRRKWKNNMSQQEVAMRMNEATKMIDPTNYKFLDQEAQERTGLEINPLWMMECLVRSGLLSPKEQVTALKELATYTHSKAPSINHSTTTQMTMEDWLTELAHEEYKEINPPPAMEVKAKGEGPLYQTRKDKKTLAAAAGFYASSEMMKEMEEAEFEDIDEVDWDNDT